MKQTLTKKQKLLLDYIKKFSADNGYPPSFREVMEGLKYSSVATVAQHIDNLVAKGYLYKRDNEARSIQLAEADMDLSKEGELPLMGFVAAGQPIATLDEPQETLVVPHFMIKSEHSYVLRVKGDSMIEDGVLDGDYIVVRENKHPNNGDMVVAMLKNYEATLKRFYREGSRIKLQPANSALKPIYVNSGDFIEVHGVVTGIIRSY